MAPVAPPAPAVAGAALAHDSARLHVTGEATYTDDLPEPRGTLYAALGCSPVAHGRLRGVDLAAVRAAADVVDAIVAADLPCANDVGPIVDDDPILAAGVVQFAGQPVCATGLQPSAAYSVPCGSGRSSVRPPRWSVRSPRWTSTGPNCARSGSASPRCRYAVPERSAATSPTPRRSAIRCRR